jgi:KDO2-lipid IV(A) lauroyltransferase
VSSFVAKAYLLAWRAGPHLPGALVRGLTNVGADVAWARRGGGVRRLEANLARVRPDLDRRGLRRLSRAGMRSYLRYFGEAFTLPGATRAQIDARVRVEGHEGAQRHLAEGRTVLLALGHLGNWDLAGAWASEALAPVTTVAERLEPEELFEEFVRFRESIGLTIVPLTGGGDVYRELMRTVRRGGVLLPLLADRDLTARGVEVQLFGRTARVAAGPAALAVSTGAPLYAVSSTYERISGARRRAAGTPWRMRLHFSEVVEVPEGLPRRDRVQAVTQRWVDLLATEIAAHPQDWHMLQKVFVEDLDPDRYAATAAGVHDADEDDDQRDDGRDGEDRTASPAVGGQA